MVSAVRVEGPWTAWLDPRPPQTRAPWPDAAALSGKAGPPPVCSRCLQQPLQAALELPHCSHVALGPSAAPHRLTGEGSVTTGLVVAVPAWIREQAPSESLRGSGRKAQRPLRLCQAPRSPAGPAATRMSPGPAPPSHSRPAEPVRLEPGAASERHGGGPPGPAERAALRLPSGLTRILTRSRRQRVGPTRTAADSDRCAGDSESDWGGDSDFLGRGAGSTDDSDAVRVHAPQASAQA